jgi:hypothetical protein
VPAGDLLRTTYFEVDDNFFQQNDGMAMGALYHHSLATSTWSTSEQHKTTLWLRYVDDTFVVWPHGPEHLQDLLNHLNSLEPAIQFTMETEPESAIPF